MERSAAFGLMQPHLGAAYDLARWLTRSDHDAEDVFQEATLRALKYVGSFDGSSIRTWLLTIVRHTAYAWLAKNRPADVAGHGAIDPAPTPEQHAVNRADARAVDAALGALTAELREVIVLRELEGLSYKEIAEVAGVPIGTVMSRLSRARKALQERLTR